MPQDRFWRKSRSNNTSPVGCVGTDLNRNFDFHWLGLLRNMNFKDINFNEFANQICFQCTNIYPENGGASSDPCSSVFGGTEVFSDVESRNVRDFLTSISPRLVFYLSLHSAGQYILIPTGFSSDRIPQYNTYVSK